MDREISSIASDDYGTQPGKDFGLQYLGSGFDLDIERDPKNHREWGALTKLAGDLDRQEFCRTDTPDAKGEGCEEINVESSCIKIADQCNALGSFSTYEDHGGFSAWGYEPTNEPKMARSHSYPSTELINGIMQFRKQDRVKVKRSKGNRNATTPRRAKPKAVLEDTSFDALGRHTLARSEAKDIRSNTNLHDGKETIIPNSLQNRQQLVLPKVGNWKTQQQQIHLSKNGTSNFFTYYPQAEHAAKFDTCSTHLPPIFGDRISQLKPTKYRFQIPPGSQICAPTTGKQANSKVPGNNMTARWKSSIPRELQASATKEKVITKNSGKNTINSKMKQVYRVGGSTNCSVGP